MTYRERREARAGRLRAWADKRQTEATATLERDRQMYAGDVAFHTQPGRIPERSRLIARTDRALESLNKAASMSSRAESIEEQLDRAIYTDDEDAEQALVARIADLEAARARIKAYNKTGDESVLDDKQRADLASLMRFDRRFDPVTREWVSRVAGDPFPAYALTNLSANINRNRKRLEQMIRETA